MDKPGQIPSQVYRDTFRELPFEEWPKLRDVFKADWPFSIYAFYVVENFINWKKKDASVEVTILCPQDGYADGTMALIHTTQTQTTIYVFTLDKSCQQLHNCLYRTNLIDWSVGPFFYSIHSKHWDAVKGALIKLKIPTEYQILSSYHWIHKDDAMKFDVICPPDVYIAPLEERDIKTINDIWPHRYPGSENFIKSLLFVNGGLGIFSKDDKTLRSWIIKNNHLGLGMLQTADDHKRKGYGKLMIMALSKDMACEGHDIHTCIVRSNNVSLNLFKSLGFKRVDNLMFEKIKPTMSHV